MASKQPWVHFPYIWKTEAAFLSYIRGGIRSALWKDNPVKIEFMNHHRRKIVNTNPKSMKRTPMVWGAECYQCGHEYPLSKMEVDHIVGEHTLRKVEDIQSFIEGIVFVSFEDLGFICVDCHRAKTYSERYGLDFAASVREKKAIALCKKPANEVKDWIKERGELPGATAAQRRLQVVALLKKEEEQNVHNSSQREP